MTHTPGWGLLGCCAAAARQQQRRSTLNGEANFEWRPAAKATTQLITHVTSKYRQQ